MDVARLNFSHGTPEEHAARVAAVRRASAHYEKPVAILADLQGPKIRTGALERGLPVQLHFGQKFTITTRKIVGTSRRRQHHVPRTARTPFTKAIASS